MAKFTVLQNNFISGELNPHMEGRIDSERYKTGLSICENFIPTRLGSLIKRPGTRYVAKLDDGVGDARLAMFDAGYDGKFMVEFTEYKARFWTDYGTIVKDQGNDVFELVTPYSVAEIHELSCQMNKSVMYIVHHNHPPAIIEQDSPDPFKISEPNFTGHRTFSQAGDYPSCQTFKGGRYYLAATDNAPNTIWASRTPDSLLGDRFFDFTMFEEIDGDDVTLSTHAIELQETDMHGSRIKWMVNQKRILAGAGRTIWMDSGAVPTPATFDMMITLNDGVADILPKALDNYVIYAGTGGRTLNIMQYRTDDDGYINAEISLTAKHIIKSGIKAFDLLNGEYGSVLWVICNDGTLASCTIDIGSNVTGWARHPLGKDVDGYEMTVLSLEIMPGDDQIDDVLWLTVNRSGSIYIEILDMSQPNGLYDARFVDCATNIEFTPKTDTITVPHLANQEVDALADEAILPRKVLDEHGTTTYDRTFKDIVIGYPIRSTIKLLRPELPANGTSQGKTRQLLEQTLRLYRSLGGKAIVGSTESPILPLIPGDYRLGSIFPEFTGDKRLQIIGYAGKDEGVEIKSNEPLPFTLLAVMSTYGITEV